MKVFFLQNVNMPLVWFDLFLELTLYLKEKYNAEVFTQKSGFLYIEEFKHNLPDCEIVIYDEEKDILKAVSWSEGPSGLLRVFSERANKEDIFVMSQFHGWFQKDFDRTTLPYTLKSSTYYPFYARTNYDYFYHLRQWSNYEDLIDMMFCLTSTGRDDVPRLRDAGLCSPSPGPLNIDDYLNMAIKYKVGFSVHGVAEVCHREFDYMAIGLPNLRLEYMTQLDPPLIPDYHYISVPRDNFPWDGHAHRVGGPEYIEAYRKRFYEVKDDFDFLQFIAKNGRDYYEKYCSPQNRLSYILNLLNID
jgi:hypothetical protein